MLRTFAAVGAAVIVGALVAVCLVDRAPSKRVPSAPVITSGPRHAELTWVQKSQMQTMNETANKIRIATAAGDHLSACTHVGVLSELLLSLTATLPPDTVEYEEAKKAHRSVVNDYQRCRGF